LDLKQQPTLSHCYEKEPSQPDIPAHAPVYCDSDFDHYRSRWRSDSANSATIEMGECGGCGCFANSRQQLGFFGDLYIEYEKKMGVR
jgi:hypothetical protein